jgi:hypothetical protein
MNPGKIRLDISGPVAIIFLNSKIFTISISLGSSAQAGFFVFISDHIALEPVSLPLDGEEGIQGYPVISIYGDAFSRKF